MGLNPPLSSSLLLSVCPNRLDPYLERGNFTEVGRRTSSRTRSGGVMRIASIRRPSASLAAKSMEFPDLSRASPRPAKTLKGVGLNGSSLDSLGEGWGGEND